MKFEHSVELKWLVRDGQRLAYRVYKRKDAAASRRLLMLHGAGVAGVDTWQAMLNFLDGWDEFLVPDFRGTGSSESEVDAMASFAAADLVEDTQAILTQEGWQSFDLVGYSLGGLVSLLLKHVLSNQIEKQFLLEAATLERQAWDETVELRNAYVDAVANLREGQPLEGARQFLDIIAPNRRVAPAVERLTLERLAARPKGFANALSAVAQAMDGYDREGVLSTQGDVTAFVGGNSVAKLHDYQTYLMTQQNRWHYFSVAGTDHSLPYQKPRQIGRIMTEELARYLIEV